MGDLRPESESNLHSETILGKKQTIYVGLMEGKEWRKYVDELKENLRETQRLYSLEYANEGV